MRRHASFGSLTAHAGVGMRNLLFAAASFGGVLAILGVAGVALAWLYPHLLIEQLGPEVTADDLQASYNVQLMGTLLGLVVASAGMAIAVFSFRQLSR